jgi:hypothetical protein
MDQVTDFSAALPLDESVLTIEAPDGKPTTWRVTLAGPAHPKTVVWADRAARQNLRRQQMQEQAQVNGKKWKAEERTPEEQRRQNVEWVVARIVGWTPVRIEQFSPDPIPFSEPVAINLLSQPYMGFVFKQLVDYLSDEASFTKRSETIS